MLLLVLPPFAALLTATLLVCGNLAYVCFAWSLWTESSLSRVNISSDFQRKRHQNSSSMLTPSPVRSEPPQSLNFPSFGVGHGGSGGGEVKTLLTSRPLQGQKTKGPQTLRLQEEEMRPRRTLCSGPIVASSVATVDMMPIAVASSGERPGPHAEFSLSDYSAFLWIYYFVVPRALLTVAGGVAALMVRCMLQRWGLCKVPDFEPRRAVGELLLESMEVLHYRGQRGIPGGGDIATFCWEQLPMITQNGGLREARRLSIDVHLQGRMMVFATLDGQELKPSEALILVWFNMTLGGYTDLLASADLKAYMSRHVDASVSPSRVALAKVVRNLFGSADWRSRLTVGFTLDLGKSVALGLDGGFTRRRWHAAAELAGHSELCDLVAKLRPLFLAAFSDNGASDGAEALFASMILRSLGHAATERSLSDPMWLDAASREFGCMADMGRLARAACFNDFGQLPLTREAYAQAARIDAWLIGVLDTCVVE
eukprot:CAMPEP_0115181808 /NCGR_PEP_ID=MMETSP0270-20121206/7620_1 /TAXON_ID=71861 /ORGANISM="Scrippsiella trochoidea, Strain CCMP3099" /LENGTH=483 /DNA_ID=CAMNT_0002594839 /DNA_START=87 /DNA_END=1538 /DNA_ORIENTATION=+